MENTPTCQRCNTGMLPVMYGFPGPEMADDAMQGKIILGGCCVTENDPRWQCPACGATLPESAEQVHL